tara:strand:+ start:9701 stop:10156 length:456 start_codon:yes stop_codon:yes gene_type:complete
MPRKINWKKGIAPLIATLLLVSFAVAIGVVVMNLGKAQVELGAQCVIDIGLENKGICFNQNTGKIEFALNNGVNIKVEGFLVNIIGTNQASTAELNDVGLDKAGSFSGVVAYDKSTGGEIRQLRISPKVVLYDKELICTEKSVVVESVANC